MAKTSQPVCRSTWCLVLGWGFRLNLDFYRRGLHTRTAVARNSCQGRLLHWSMDAACVLEKTRGTKIMHIFVKNGGRKIKGVERLNYSSACLHCLPLIFSKIFSLAIRSLDYILFSSPNQGTRNIYTARTVKSVSLLKVGRKSVDLPSCTFDDLMSPNWSHKI